MMETTNENSVKSTRTFDMVDVNDVEYLFNLLKHKNISDSEAMTAIGYKNPSGTLSEMRRVGLTKKTIKYALMGLIAEKKISTDTQDSPFSMSFDESELAYEAVRKARKIWPKLEAEYISLQSRIANHMAQVAQKIQQRKVG